MKPHAELPSIGFLSTYPPTSCGLATFAAALRGAIADGRGTDAGLGVVSLVDGRIDNPPAEVTCQHLNGDRQSLARAIATLNSFDVVFVEHEYGIYGGPDGSEVLDLMAGLRVPAIVTLHTVLTNPGEHQRSVLEEAVALSQGAVVMSETARRRLIHDYEIDATKVQMIPHGARTSLGDLVPEHGPRPVAITWGLIGPGKGLETAIDAFADLKDLRPMPRYIILGKTHPKVRASQGDEYLEKLTARVHALGLDELVEFDTRYLDAADLDHEIRGTDLVVLPYESAEQVTSGVLVEAIAAGKPVVATAFPHAVELLSAGAGIVVSHNDPIAMGDGLRSILTNPSLADQMSAEARRIASTLYWPAVAQQYRRLARKVVGQGPAVQSHETPTHLERNADVFANVS